MNTPSLKRHPALQPFSRDHYTGLVQAQHLLHATEEDSSGRCRVVKDFAHAWQAEIQEHFADEEALLLPLMTAAQQQRLRQDHDRLREFADQARRQRPDVDPGAGWVHELGQLLNDHIRWEERELFRAIEQVCSDEQLTALERRTAELEARRPRGACSRPQHPDTSDPGNNEKRHE